MPFRDEKHNRPWTRGWPRDPLLCKSRDLRQVDPSYFCNTSGEVIILKTIMDLLSLHYKWALNKAFGSKIGGKPIRFPLR